MRSSKSLKISIVGIGIALNIIGAFIALNLRLPIYLDSLGTIMAGFVLGPVYGVITGVLGSLTSGITFDIYSLYFAPVQIFTGFFAGYFFKKGLMNGKKIFLSVLIMTLFVSFTGAVITAYLFGGVTSSGSSYIIVILNNLGVNPVVSAFITQFLTDYADKLIACLIMVQVVRRLPKNILLRTQNK
ncbi:ECF transporter S component [Clostridium sp. B9]|uniref:ECF transporter S component n=1 Tax=Clostridium sp. B9 TaxID=3423224 RepID=UPI003D2F1E2D